MTAPQTGVEATGTWLPLAEEGGFLDQIVADHPDIIVQTVGTSTTRSLPLRRVTIGRAPAGAPCVMVLGGVHGNEPAGREGVLAMIRDLAYSTDPLIVNLLSRVRFEFMPTVNPQGRYDDHRSVFLVGGGVRDPNRDYINSTLAEVRAVHDLAAEVTPVVVLDYHEYLAPTASLKTAQTLVTTNPNVDPGVSQLIYELEDAAWAGWAAAGIPHERYAALSPDPDTGWNFQALRHAVTITPETPAHPLAEVTPEQRAHMMAVFTDAALGWIDQNLVRIVATCAAAHVSAGKSTRPFELGSIMIDPAPSRYVDLAAMPDVLGRYGVAGTVAQVSAAQSLYPVIVYALDPSSPYAQTTATRIYPDPPPPPPSPLPGGELVGIEVYTDRGVFPVVEGWYQDGAVKRPLVVSRRSSD